MSGGKTWNRLYEQELDHIFGRAPTKGEEDASGEGDGGGDWPPEWAAACPDTELFALALSGGGIRSATFNLGLLQELDHLGLLERFHYLSTVSGGGYMGGFWSAWRARPGRSAADLFPGSEPTRDQPEPKEVRHLREFSNFLRPRASLLSVETARIVAALVAGVFPCIAIAFSFLTLCLASWLGLAVFFTAHEMGVAFAFPLVPALVSSALTLLGLCWLEIRSEPRPSRGERGSSDLYWLWAVVASLASGLIAAFVWFVAASPTLLLAGLTLAGWPAALGNAFLPAVPWLAVSMLFIGLRIAASRVLPNDPPGRARLAAVDRALTRLFLAAAVWLAVALAWVAGQLVAGIGVSGVLGALGTGTTAGALFAWIRRNLLRQSNVPTAGNLRLRLGIVLYQALAYLAVTAVIAASAAQLVLAYQRFGLWGFLAFLGLIAAILGIGLLADPHEIGLHRFYRARLVRAYLGASNPDPTVARATRESPGDDVPLEDLAGRPFHLICCAANDLSGDPLGSLNRGAETAVASKIGLQIGDRWREWSRKTELPYLSDVLTASGAAFNSHMGQLSARFGKAVTFLLTALGLRLGLWIENPSTVGKTPKKKAKRKQAAIGKPDGQGVEEETGDEDRPGSTPRAPGTLFLRELLGNSSSRARWVHLSDGAHFENLALYELIRRHCRFILLSDCGADPDRGFDDFGNAVRRVREDFGVEIEIDISPLKTDAATGKLRQPMVAGDIHYPPARSGGEPDSGILLYIKPTITGREPPDVSQYHGRNARFPHETTLDQFYDEAQWESYRRLGRHAARSAFLPLAQFLGKEGESVRRRFEDATAVFLRARYYWPPIPAEESEIDRFEDAWTKLVASLGDPKLEALRIQVTLPAGNGKAKTLGDYDERALLNALPAVREAIRTMEGVYLRTGFGATPRSPSHQRYMGWLNRMGIWSAAPIFRTWWPWLAPFRSGRFNAFMAESFGLTTEPFRSGSVDDLSPAEIQGFAFERWAKVAHPPPDPNAASCSYLGYFVPLGPELPVLNAAVVRFRTESDGKASGPKIARWVFRDFYVAPGLWSLSIGETFLRKLLGELAARGYEQAVLDPGRSLTSTEEALYTGAGFRRRNGSLVRDLDEFRPPAVDAGAATGGAPA